MELNDRYMEKKNTRKHMTQDVEANTDVWKQQDFFFFMSSKMVQAREEMKRCKYKVMREGRGQ